MPLVFVLALLAPAASAVPAPQAAAQAGPACDKAPALDKGTVRAIEVGRSWAGTRVPFGAAATPNGQLIVAYYDADRAMTVASVDVARATRCAQRLPSKFGGWDSHNLITVATAGDGTVHVAGNMHVSPLFYARGSAADVGSIARAGMIGRDEDRVTYPQFLHDSAGNLLFLYRNGGSGAGTWLANRWRGGQWQRVGPLFADHDRTGPVSAYPSDFVRGPDGVVHVAIVWRRTPDIASNFAVSYVSTRDFATWQGADGRTVAGPIGPESTPPVEAPGENVGLVNNVVLKLTGQGQPVVFFTRYGTGGRNAIIAARPGAGGWRLREVATAARRIAVSGGGTLPGLPMILPADESGGKIPLRLVFPPSDSRWLAIDPATLAAQPSQAPRWTGGAGPALPKPDLAGMASPATITVDVAENGVDGVLRWYAQGANGDRPRACAAPAVKACDPPASPLTWIGTPWGRR